MWVIALLYFNSIVLLGRFNPAIFQTQWLDRYKILPDQDIQSAQGEKADVQEVPFKDGKLVISKTPEMVTTSDFAQLNFPKIKLTVQRERYQCGTFERESFSLLKDVTIKIFNLLSHTPVKAVGINFDAHLEFEKDAEYILKSFFVNNHKRFADLFGEDYGIKGSIKTKIIGDVDTIEFAKSNRFDNSIYIHSNFHKIIATENAEEAINWINDNHTKSIDAIIKIIIDLLGEPKKVWTPQQQKK